MEKLHLFYRNNSNRSLKIYRLRLEAYLEVTKGDKIKFMVIEKIFLFSRNSNDDEPYIDFSHAADIDSPFCSEAKTLSDLKKHRKSMMDMDPIDKQNYERIRRIIFSIYDKHNKGLDLNKITL